MVTAAQERDFERALIARQRERYLATDVMEKVARDPGYAEKVRLIEAALTGVTGKVLDVGSNTCGEAEYLVTRGFRIIASDVNELALEISAERCRKFGRPAPEYLPADAHDLPVPARSVAAVVFNESLHHMERPEVALREAVRVLVPGGIVFLYEPYAYNPYRRLSEVRDRFRGTIERSFSVRQLTRFLEHAGLTITRIERHVATPSDWRMAGFNPAHRILRRVYHSASRSAPGVFGNIMVTARKP